MIDLFLKTRPVAVILGAMLASACGSVPQYPAMSANGATASAGTSTSVTADINRNIAAAAMSQTSAASLDYQLGPEDLLEITLFNVPEGANREQHITPRTMTARVTHRGQISLPLIGELSIKGLTVTSLEGVLRDRYDKFIHNPQIGVLVKEFRQRVSVIGAVQKPGPVELTGPKTVIEILAIAGGVNDKAGNQVHLYRQGGNGRETHVIDLTVLANSVGLIDANNSGMINMPVQSGDMINIPEAGMFFVDGAVRKPGSYPLGRRYTLTQALATAGGVDNELNSDEISIFRRQKPGELQTVALKLTSVLSGNVADPQIQPDDVIIVPTSTAKFIVKRFIGTLVGGMSIGAFIP